MQEMFVGRQVAISDWKDEWKYPFFRNLRSKLYFPERNSKGNGIGNSRNGTSLEKMLKSPHCLTAWTQKAKVQQE